MGLEHFCFTVLPSFQGVERTKSPVVSLDEDYKEHGADSSHLCLGKDERQQIKSPSAKFQ